MDLDAARARGPRDLSGRLATGRRGLAARAIVGYSPTNTGRKLAASLAVANFVEGIIAGGVTGLVCERAASAARRA